MLGSSYFSMKYIQHIICFILSSLALLNSTSFSDSSDTGERDLLITFTEESELTIIGKTNLGKFSCYCHEWQDVDHEQFKGKIQDHKIYFNHAALEIPVEALRCQNRMMTSDLHELLCANNDEGSIKVTFKEAEWYLNSLWSDKISQQEPIGYFNILLTIGGITQESKVEIYSSEEKSEHYTLSTRGAIALQLSEFNIDPPSKMMGMVKVKNTLEILLDLHFSWEEI